MTDGEISILRGHVSRGVAYWSDPDSNLCRIKEVPDKEYDLDGDGVTEPVALLEGGAGHIGLLNVDPTELYIVAMVPMFN